ncbi:ExbD/TolR family protein [Arhodomonas sp. AD133]|uniref:ExbD/TolR family protein n=1 Tax=Arhodomonas sp. AD133 TaxID=3415009 RepID=UPI003EBFA3B9
MQLPSTPERRGGDDLLPLINIIFLLLIFFMLAGTMTSPEAFPVHPPDSRHGKAAENDADLLIGPDGDLAWRGERVTAETLVTQIGDKPPQRIVVRADGEVASARLMPVLKRLRNAGVERVSLITRRDDE